MKKFTVISLLLVLVAGFTFAAGLTPYVTSKGTVTFNGVVKDYGTYEDNKAKKNAFLTSIDFGGQLVYGVKNAAEDVDVNLSFDVAYNDRAINESRTDLENMTKKVDAPYTDKLTFTPAFNVTYSGSNLKATFVAKTALTKSAWDIFEMDYRYKDLEDTTLSEKLGYKLTQNFEIDADAIYACALNNGNIFRANIGEDVLFTSADEFTTTSIAGVAYFIPGEGATAKAAIPATFVNYKLKAYVNASLSFGAKNGNLKANTNAVSADAGLIYNYNDEVSFNATGTLAAKENAISGYTFHAGAEYDKAIVKGANKKDNFEFDATATLDTTSAKTTTVGAEVAVSVPRIIPVELVDNASFNLPATFTASYENALADKESTFTFTIDTYPVYVEFKNAYKLFGKFINVLTANVQYGNEATFKGKVLAGEKVNNYFFGAGLKLELDPTTQGKLTKNGAALSINYKYTENTLNIPGTVTLSYTTAY